MQHAMRRSERELSPHEAKEILAEGSYGILSTCGTDGEPYGVPLSYACLNGEICFHCAPDSGHKLANIAENPRVCFTVIKPGSVHTLPEQFSTLYRSAIAFGQARELHGDAKRAALAALVEKYSPAFRQEGEAYIARAFDKVAVYAIRIERLTGKGRK